MASTWCLYYLQDEPGESAEVPNCVEVPRQGRVLLRDLLAAWPLKTGVFHYRFRVDVDPRGHCWLDVVDPLEALPLSDGFIHAKVPPIPFPARSGHTGGPAFMVGCFNRTLTESTVPEAPRASRGCRYCGWTSPRTRPVV
jgi:hypothetical protein